MKFADEYKKTVEIITPDDKTLERMKANVMARVNAPAKAFVFRRVALIGGSVAACAVITVSAVLIVPKMRGVNISNETAAGADYNKSAVATTIAGSMYDVAEDAAADSFIDESKMTSPSAGINTTLEAAAEGIFDDSAPLDCSGDLLTATENDDAELDEGLSSADTPPETTTGTAANDIVTPPGNTIITDSGASDGTSEDYFVTEEICVETESYPEETAEFGTFDVCDETCDAGETEDGNGNPSSGGTIDPALYCGYSDLRPSNGTEHTFRLYNDNFYCTLDGENYHRGSSVEETLSSTYIYYREYFADCFSVNETDSNEYYIISKPVTEPNILYIAYKGKNSVFFYLYVKD